MSKHCYASEAVLRALANHLEENEEEWGLAGLLHDIDVEITNGDPLTHGPFAEKLLEGKILAGHNVIQMDFTDSGLSSMDEQFMQKVLEVVNDLHPDPQFNTIAFAQAIGLGRIQLNRKIKALTGQTTVNFIRTYRLNHAAELIKNKSATIAEIAYDVGFNSPSYFTECFREYFGTLPSEYNGND